MEEIIYKNKIIGTEIALNDMKKMIKNGNIMLNVARQNINTIANIGRELIPEKIKIIEYYINQIPFSDDWEIKKENQFSQDELRILMDNISEKQEYWRDPKVNNLFDKIVKMYRDKEYEEFREYY